MLRATIWRDLRWRLLATALLVAPVAAVIAWSYVAQTAPRPAYLAYLDGMWFQLPGASAVFLPAAVLLGASGTLLRPRNDLAYLLTLPISRWRWLLAHAAMSTCALAVLVVAVDAGFLISAWRTGEALGVGPLLARSLAVLAASSVWVAITLGTLSLVRRPILAIVLVMGVVVTLPASRFRLEIPMKPPTPALSAWDPWAFVDPRAWHEGVPVASILVAIALAAAGLMVARYRLERFEP